MSFIVFSPELNNWVRIFRWSPILDVLLGILVLVESFWKHLWEKQIHILTHTLTFISRPNSSSKVKLLLFRMVRRNCDLWRILETFAGKWLHGLSTFLLMFSSTSSPKKSEYRFYVLSTFFYIISWCWELMSLQLWCQWFCRFSLLPHWRVAQKGISCLGKTCRSWLSPKAKLFWPQLPFSVSPLSLKMIPGRLPCPPTVVFTPYTL